MRENLDPFQEKSDEEVWQVLREVQLAKTVEQDFKDGLMTLVTESTGLFSVGQK